jgi:hypothetical protein
MENYTEETSSWGTKTCSVIQQIPKFYEARYFITVFKTVRTHIYGEPD